LIAQSNASTHQSSVATLRHNADVVVTVFLMSFDTDSKVVCVWSTTLHLNNI
jgi:hypothetical protein